jgi:hypothetical protein
VLISFAFLGFSAPIFAQADSVSVKVQEALQYEKQGAYSDAEKSWQDQDEGLVRQMAGSPLVAQPQ